MLNGLNSAGSAGDVLSLERSIRVRGFQRKFNIEAVIGAR